MKVSRQYEPQRRARRRALQALYQWKITGQQAAEIIEQFFEEQDFSGVDEDLFRMLVEGVIESSEVLDQVLEPFIDRPAGQLDLMEAVILKMASFELMHSRQVPMRVVLDEAIELARRFGAEQGHGFVNAVLDKAAPELQKAGEAVNPDSSK